MRLSDKNACFLWLLTGVEDFLHRGCEALLLGLPQPKGSPCKFHPLAVMTRFTQWFGGKGLDGKCIHIHTLCTGQRAVQLPKQCWPAQSLSPHTPRVIRPLWRLSPLFGTKNTAHTTMPLCKAAAKLSLPAAELHKGSCVCSYLLLSFLRRSSSSVAASMAAFSSSSIFCGPLLAMYVDAAARKRSTTALSPPMKVSPSPATPL